MKKKLSPSGVLTGNDGVRFLEHLYHVISHEPSKKELKERERKIEEMNNVYEEFKAIATFKF